MQIQVAYADGDWRCYATDDARRRRYIGCAHRVPAAAIAHSDYVARHDVPTPPTARASDLAGDQGTPSSRDEDRGPSGSPEGLTIHPAPPGSASSPGDPLPAAGFIAGGGDLTLGLG